MHLVDVLGTTVKFNFVHLFPPGHETNAVARVALNRCNVTRRVSASADLTTTKPSYTFPPSNTSPSPPIPEL